MSQNKSGNLDYKGEKWKGSKTIEKIVRVLSTKEVAAITAKFRSQSDLLRDQFVVSSFAYPTMPKPFVRRGYNQVRIAPKEVNKKYFGHPIYWIEPGLTEQRSNERNQEWLIRMFYLIDGLGYWQENGSFIDFLDVNDFSFRSAQIEAYHNISELNAETNGFGLLDETDLQGVTLEEVEEKTKEAITRCSEIEQNENIKMLQAQAFQYSFAKNILGPEVRNWASSPTDKGSFWDTAVLPKIADINSEYDRRAEEGNTIVSDLLASTKSLVKDIEVVIERINTASSILALPVQAAARGASASRISLLATMLSSANSENNLRRTKFAKLDEAVKESFTAHGNTGISGFEPVIKAMEELYKESWNSLKFNFINYDNYRNNDTVYATLVEMNSALQREKMANSGGLGSVFGTDFRVDN